MTALRIAPWLIGVLAASMLAGSPAQAATGDVSFLYDWSGDAQYGFEGFSAPEATNPDPNDPLNQPPMTVTLQPPYYAAYAGTRGRGFRLQPSPASDGARDRVFPNYRIGDASGGPRIAVAFTAPGTLEIRVGGRAGRGVPQRQRGPDPALRLPAPERGDRVRV